MKNCDLISVIVPIYNVEKYLKKCIESIIQQTYDNLEIILINDGSTDNSPKICDNYAKKDKRIKVIHKKNGGLSDARNYGLEIATGKYISFVDSDDYIHKQMIEKLYNNLKANYSDISICNICNVYPNGKKMNLSIPETSVVEQKQKFYNIYNKYSVVTVVAWNKLYKKEIFKTIRYPLGKVHEDEWIIFDILKNAQKISYLNEPLYYYIQREESISNSFNLKRLHIIEVHENRLKQLKGHDDLLKMEYIAYILCLSRKIIPGLYAIKNKQKAKEYRKKNKQLINYTLKNYQLSKKDKISFYLIKISPLLYVKTYKLYCILKDAKNKK